MLNELGFRINSDEEIDNDGYNRPLIAPLFGHQSRTEPDNAKPEMAGHEPLNRQAVAQRRMGERRYFASRGMAEGQGKIVRFDGFEGSCPAIG